MKTPREILLAHHQDAVPRLDALRREVMATEIAAGAPSGKRPLVRSAVLPPGWLKMFWLQLVHPCRGAWAALAAAWCLIVGLHALTGDEPRTRLSPGLPQSAEVTALLEEQRQLRAELLGVRRERLATSQPAGPRPRSELGLPWRHACRDGAETELWPTGSFRGVV